MPALPTLLAIAFNVFIACVILYAVTLVISIRAKMDVIALELKGIRELLKR